MLGGQGQAEREPQSPCCRLRLEAGEIFEEGEFSPSPDSAISWCLGRMRWTCSLHPETPRGLLCAEYWARCWKY